MEAAVSKVNYDLIQAGPVGSLDAYIQGVGAIPVLTKEAELKLAERYNNEEDLEAAADVARVPSLAGSHTLRPETREHPDQELQPVRGQGHRLWLELLRHRPPLVLRAVQILSSARGHPRRSLRHEG